MSKYTKEQVIELRKCGLKYLDKAITMAGSKQVIIDNAIKIHKEFPCIWGPGWPSMSWAFINAVREILNPDRDIAMPLNLNEALTEEELMYIQKECGFGSYTDTDARWKRKKSKI